MKTRWIPALLLFVAAVAGTAGGPALAEPAMAAPGSKILMITPDQLQWQQGPQAIPGSMVTVLDGDPKKAGFFVMRLKLPAGAKIPPHVHENVERVTVISGKINLAMGDRQENPTAIPAGGYFSIQPNVLHNAWVDEETVLQIATMGPWTFKPQK